MASLKNVDKTKQRIHKERAQLSHREYLGNLEKKKDYKIRSKQSNEKRDTLKTLRKKALERNPDEFYFHMVNSQVERGVHHEKEKTDEENTFEQDQLMRTQNLRYVSYKLQNERKKIDKSLAGLHMCDPTIVSNTHTIFVDSKKEIKRFNPAKRFKTHSSLVDRPFNRLTNEALRAKPVGGMSTKEEIKASEKERKNEYELLSKRIAREKELRIVQQKLMTKKSVEEGRKRGLKPKKVKKGGTKQAVVYKWPQERKK